MQKLYSTTSKDTFTAILDILEIHKIDEKHHDELNAESKVEYFIYVGSEDFLRANNLLKELLWETLDADKYEVASDKILLKKYLVAVFQDQEKKDEYEKQLYEKGFTDDELQEIIDTEYETGFVKKHYTEKHVVWVIVGLVLGGIGAFLIALYIRFSKSTHPLSLERYQRYDKRSRKHAEFLIVASAIVAYFSIEIIY